MGTHGMDITECKACSDFTSWARAQSVKNEGKVEMEEPSQYKDCPLNSISLGNNTWSFLHTMAAYYPNKPTDTQQKDMLTFLNLFSKFYPCKLCADDLQRDMKQLPPVADSAEALSQWLCQIHNRVNVKLGKPIFDCSKVFERWRDGWKDGSCD